MTRLAYALLLASLILSGCASPYDGTGRTPPQIGAGMTAGRTSGR